MELIDEDISNSDELIDRYIIDITLPVGSSIKKTNLKGIFNFTEVSMRIEAQCRPGFVGEFCLTDESKSQPLKISVSSINSLNCWYDGNNRRRSPNLLVR